MDVIPHHRKSLLAKHKLSTVPEFDAQRDLGQCYLAKTHWLSKWQKIASFCEFSVSFAKFFELWALELRLVSPCNSCMAVMTVVQMHRFCSLAGPGISQECGFKRRLVGIHTMSLAFPKWGSALEDVLKGSVSSLLKNPHLQISLDSAGALGCLWITLTTQITLCTNST